MNEIRRTRPTVFSANEVREFDLPQQSLGRRSQSAAPASRVDNMRIAMVGTRGVPAAYGGFETAVEEIGRRLVERGHEVTVYCRTQLNQKEHLGMLRVELGSLKRRSLETLSHSALSSVHATVRLRPDMAFVFNSANSPWLELFRLARIPTALHTDGLEWQRSKWSSTGKKYYRYAERLGVRWADELISDAEGIADYYWTRFGVKSNVISYGAPIVHPPADLILELDLQPHEYDLIVARVEPENHVLEALDGALRAGGDRPVVVVGSIPYPTSYSRELDRLASKSPRARLLGAVWDQDLLDSLYAHARVYLHGHSVGGTNPSLLRAMGAGAPVAAFDVTFNREVLAGTGMFWDSSDALAELLRSTEARHLLSMGESARSRAAGKYRWDDVAAAYERLAQKLVSGRRPAPLLDETA
jgi:glycosyltransferase involved in cell wall biosynthesis